MDASEIPALPHDDPDALARAAAELVERWLTTGRERQLARYELALEATRRPHLREVLVASGAGIRARVAERFAAEGTRLADAHHGVSDETWAQVRKHYDDDQIAALVSLVALINAANRLAVIVHQQGGSYEPGMFAATFN